MSADFPAGSMSGSFDGLDMIVFRSGPICPVELTFGEWANGGVSERANFGDTMVYCTSTGVACGLDAIQISLFIINTYAYTPGFGDEYDGILGCPVGAGDSVGVGCT